MFKRFLLLLTLFGFSAVYAQDVAPNLTIIPAPVSLKKSEGIFTLSQLTVIQADTPSNRSVGVFSAAVLSGWGLRTQVTKTDNSVTSNVIRFTSAGAEALPAEGYLPYQHYAAANCGYRLRRGLVLWRANLNSAIAVG
jgi:hexosaminidase